MRRPAECGTDSGYYQHTRKWQEEACDACKQAHAIAERLRLRKQPPEPVFCDCGRRMLNPSYESCAACRRTAARKEPRKETRLCDCGRRILTSWYDCCYCRGTNRKTEVHEFDPGEDPIAWRREGLIWKPVWADEEGVA